MRSLLLVPLLAIACATQSESTSADNCPMSPFTNGAVVGSLTESSAGPSFLVKWQPPPAGAWEPPMNYYEAPRLVASPASLVRGARLEAPYALRVELAPLGSYLATSKRLSLSLEFPDTRSYAACQHPGMRDRYFVEVVLELDASGALAKSSVSPMKVDLGSI